MQLKLKLEMVEFLVNAPYGFRETFEFGVPESHCVNTTRTAAKRN